MKTFSYDEKARSVSRIVDTCTTKASQTLGQPEAEAMRWLEDLGGSNANRRG
jgi:hypothetical protein